MQACANYVVISVLGAVRKSPENVDQRSWNVDDDVQETFRNEKDVLFKTYLYDPQPKGLGKIIVFCFPFYLRVPFRLEKINWTLMQQILISWDQVSLQVFK